MSILPNPKDPDYSDKLDAIGVPTQDPRDEIPNCEECKHWTGYDEECDDPELQENEWPFCFEPIISALDTHSQSTNQSEAKK